jgi:hypothetical protein
MLSASKVGHEEKRSEDATCEKAKALRHALRDPGDAGPEGDMRSPRHFANFVTSSMNAPNTGGASVIPFLAALPILKPVASGLQCPGIGAPRRRKPCV